MIVVYDDAYARHLRDVRHPESPDRVTHVIDYLAANRLLEQRSAARDASDTELFRVHPQGYVERVARDVDAIDGGRAAYLSTGDTVIDSSSLDVARRAAGGAVAAIDRAAAHEAPVFAILRPPGHHAEPVRGMGFCIFNNVAVAARSFVAEHGGRVLVVDFDYHHGNGTQAATGDGVSFVSTHAYPQYPGTGASSENVYDAGGAIVNVPLPPDRYETEAFVATWQHLLPAVAERVRPDALVVSAGYDFAAGDPVGDLGVDGPAAARALAVLVRDVAERFCRGRVAYCLEGGYDPQTLAECVAATLRAHDETAPAHDLADPGAVPPRQRAILSEVDAWLS